MKSGVLYSNAAALDGIIDGSKGWGEGNCSGNRWSGKRKSFPHCKREIILDEELLLRRSSDHL